MFEDTSNVSAWVAKPHKLDISCDARHIAQTDTRMRATHHPKTHRTAFASQPEVRPDCTGSPCDRSSLSTLPRGAIIDDAPSHSSVESTDKARAKMNGRTLESLLVDGVEVGTHTFCVGVSQGNIDWSGTSAP